MWFSLLKCHEFIMMQMNKIAILRKKSWNSQIQSVLWYDMILDYILCLLYYKIKWKVCTSFCSEVQTLPVNTSMDPYFEVHTSLTKAPVLKFDFIFHVQSRKQLFVKKHSVGNVISYNMALYFLNRS